MAISSKLLFQTVPITEFKMRLWIRALCVLLVQQDIFGVQALNLAPFFKDDMNQHTLPENSPVGSFVYQLSGEDPEGSRVFYGIEGTDKFAVDR
jgi:hypothetical protein